MRGTVGCVVTSCLAVSLLAGCGTSGRTSDAVAAVTSSSPAGRTPSPTPTARATLDVASVCAAWRSAADLEKQLDAVVQRSYDYQSAAQQKFDADMATVVTGITQAPAEVRAAASQLRTDVSFHPGEASDQAKAARINAAMTAVDDYVTDGCPNE